MRTRRGLDAFDDVERRVDGDDQLRSCDLVALPFASHVLDNRTAHRARADGVERIVILGRDGRVHRHASREHVHRRRRTLHRRPVATIELQRNPAQLAPDDGEKTIEAVAFVCLVFLEQRGKACARVVTLHGHPFLEYWTRTISA